MAEARTVTVGAPVWADLATTDVAGSRAFYTALFGWKSVESPDPQAGGYGMFQLEGKDVAGIGPTQGPGQPTAWAVYIGTTDTDQTARRVAASGGTVVAPPFDVLEAGRMAVFQDPSGAFISVWQGKTMPGAGVMHKPNTMDWAELNSRDLEGVRGFYHAVFDWGEKQSPMGEGMGSYTEWLAAGESVAGAMAMPPMVPAEVPSFWLVYFSVADLDAAAARARSLGARVQGEPMNYPGGRFAIVEDPQGAVFGLLGS